jgi:hypothetical protein
MNKRMAICVMGVVAVASLVVLGCGDEGGDESAQKPTAAQIKKAEEVVRNELPNVPFWEDASFHGTATEDGDVCVDRFYAQDSAELLGGGRNAGYVVVAIPAMTTEQPQDGTCKDRRETSQTEPSAEDRAQEALGSEVSSDFAPGEAEVRSVNVNGQLLDIALSTPEGGFEGPSTDDTDALASAALARAYADANWQGAAYVEFRGGLVDSATGRSLPNAETASYRVERREAKQIDWSDDTALSTIDWGIYRGFCHPALKDC